MERDIDMPIDPDAITLLFMMLVATVVAGL
jgi:hypothetical protein